MRETKTQVLKTLGGMSAADFQKNFDMVGRFLAANDDFKYVLVPQGKPFLSSLEKKLHKKVKYGFDKILDKKSFQIYREFIQAVDTKLTRAKKESLLADVLTDDTLFEGICLVYDQEDESLFGFMDGLGLSESYDALSQDPVYRKRRDYCCLLGVYTDAAVSAYGAVHVEQVLGLISKNEKALLKDTGYIRTEGSYENTVFFDPANLCSQILEKLGKTASSIALSTADGLFVHLTNYEEYSEEKKQLDGLVKQKRGVITRGDMLSFIRASKADYRKIFEMANRYPMYYPDKEEVSLYAENGYLEAKTSGAALKSYLLSKHEKELTKADPDGIETACYMLYTSVNAWGGRTDKEDMALFYEVVCKRFAACGASFEDKEDVTELFTLLIGLYNEMRLWSLHGHTLAEVGAKEALISLGEQIVSQNYSD